jgi:hypothetical protein
MARSDTVPASQSVGDQSPQPDGGDQINKDSGVKNGLEVKEPDPSLIGIDEPAAIPKGTIDPVYEAKARVLNHAVWSF